MKLFSIVTYATEKNIAPAKFGQASLIFTIGIGPVEHS